MTNSNMQGIMPKQILVLALDRESIARQILVHSHYKKLRMVAKADGSFWDINVFTECKSS